MSLVVTFIIPVRHPANAKDWGQTKTYLGKTIASITAQTSCNWEAIIVANSGSDLPDLPAQVRVQYVDFLPNPKHDIADQNLADAWEHVRLDKGRRILAGMLSAKETAYFMVVDDDDYVSRHLVAYVESQPEQVGWTIEHGYLWTEGGALACRRTDFGNLCGTSLIVAAPVYGLPAGEADASPDYIRDMLGGHYKIKTILKNRGTPLVTLPFCGAIYRIGHANSHSGTPSLASMLFFQNREVRSPMASLRALAKLRVVGSRFANEFGIDRGKVQQNPRRKLASIAGQFARRILSPTEALVLPLLWTASEAVGLVDLALL